MNHLKNPMEPQKQTTLNNEEQSHQIELESGNSSGVNGVGDGIQSQLNRINANIEKMKECFYRMMYDRGKELDRTFKGGSREFGAVEIGEHRRGNEIRNLQSKFDSQIRGPSMESEASNHPYMMNLISNGDSKASRQHTNNRSENLEAKIEALRNLINRSQTSDEGMRNSIPYATFEAVSEKFHDLKEDCVVNDYVLRFEMLKNEILATGNWSFTEEFLVQKFTNGLKHEIRSTLDIFGPVTLLEAINLARLQEGYLGMTTSNGGNISVTVELVTESLEKLPAVLVKKVEKPFEIQTEYHGDIGTLDVQLSGCEVNGLKINIEHANFGENMVVVETEDVVVEADVILVDEELGNASKGMKCGVANGINGSEVGAGDSFVASNRNSDVDEVFCANWSATGKMDLMKQLLYIQQIPTAESYNGGFIPNIGVLEMQLINEDFEDPFYDPSNPVQIPPKSELLLAAETAISMVEVKGWLAFEWEVCLLGLISQYMCAAEMVVQWLRKGVG